MPIEVNHGVDPLLQAQAAAVAAYAPAAEELRRFQDQQAFRDQQYADQQDWRVQAEMLRDAMQRRELGQRAAMQAAEIQSNNYGRELAYDQHLQDQQQVTDRAQMQTDLQSQEQLELSRRAQMSQLGQIARQQQGQQFQLAMSDYKNFNDVSHQYTPRQREQFWKQWEQKYGMSRTAPQESLSAADADEQAMRMQQNAALFRDPYDPSKSMLEEGEESVIDQLSPIEKLEFANKRRSERHRRYGLEMKEQELQQRSQLEQSKLEMQRAAGEQKQASAAKKSAHDYDSKVQQAKSRATAQYNQLVESAIKSKQDAAAFGTTVTLSDEEKLQLWERALSENPKPLEMPAS